MGKLTTEEFIEKAKKIHGDKYDYSKVEYKDYKTKVCIICKEHDEFWQTPEKHLLGRGCRKCGLIKQGHSLRKSSDDFIKEANKIHNNFYDYSKIDYVDTHTKIKIICPIHGEFWQTPHSHLNGCRCLKCGKNIISSKRKFSLEEFIQKSKKVHGDKYDYSKSNYINSKTEVEIICKTHGSFWQIPSSHWMGKGCKYCAIEYRCDSQRLSKEEFIEKANKKHNHKYDYSKVETFKNVKEIITIICPIHGEFKQSVSDHLHGGCDKCARYESSRKRSLSKEQYIERVKNIHGNKYDYSKLEYLNLNSDVTIICPIHGEFTQRASVHLYGCGCPKCKNIKGELLIEKFLKNNNIEFETQKTFNGCIYKKKLRFDFYIPSKNLCIEYDGIGHFEPVNWNHKMNENDVNLYFELYKIKDNIKTEYCKNNNINLLRIPYTEINNIESILEKQLL